MTKVFISTTDHGVARAEELGNGNWSVVQRLMDREILCLASDPSDANVVYAGTRGRGVLRSDDRGCTWQNAGLDGHTIKALAASRTQPGTLYAGLKPPLLFVSRDDGSHWTEIQAFRKARSWWWRSPAESDFGAYIQAIVLSPTDPNVIIVGIEAGAVLRTGDSGKTWEGHRPGAVRDCHSLAFHATNGDWVYEAGGTGNGAAFSRDGGRTWKQPRDRLDRHYGWACAADPAQPEVWYVSASPTFSRRHLLQPPAHVDGEANAYIFRSAGGAPWQRLGGGLPAPLSYMAYALLTDPAAPGHLYAGLSNGDVWHSANYGDAWVQLPVNLGSIHRTMIAVG